MNATSAHSGLIWASGTNLASALLLATGVALAVWSLLSREAPKPIAVEAPVATIPPVVLAPAPPAINSCDMPDLIVNLNSGTGTRRTNFLKLSFSIELEDADCMQIVPRMPRIIDNFQLYLRELRIENLQGSAGLYRLREDLLRRIRQVVAPIKVKDVLFKEMLVQ